MKINLNDKLLLSVEKPARYTGGELNSITKPEGQAEVSFALCFPDLYEIGMSHLGIKLLYHAMNERPDTRCERVFAPWTDMEAAMRAEGIPLYALESRDAVADFDIVGFTLQYEMSYTNILNMLDLARIPLLAAERGEDAPFVCGGGPCAYNPEPLADFFDFFVLGEAEESIHEVLDVYGSWKKSGTGRRAFLEQIAGIGGVYVPSLYAVAYRPDGTLESITPTVPAAPARVRKRIIRDLDKVFYPDKMVVSFIDIVHDRIMLEVYRGCAHGCRFCQAGFVYRPVREKSAKTLVASAEELVASTGYDEISLVSLSTGDYSELGELTDSLTESMSPRKVSLSLPSLRVNAASLELMDKVSKVRKSGLTFAPEAGTQRMRDVINKGVTEEELLRSAELAFRGGWNTIKLYFMIGLPTEMYEDLDGIMSLAYRTTELYRKANEGRRVKPLSVNVSVSSFVPKPFTPFQWEPMDSVETLTAKQNYIRGKIRSKNIKYSYHDADLSRLEGVFARGDRRLGAVLTAAWRLGCKFDSWGEHLRKDLWAQAFEQAGVAPEFYSDRTRSFDEVLPWSHIDIGVTEHFFKRENERAHRAETTPDCRESCSACGAAVLEGGGDVGCSD